MVFGVVYNASGARLDSNSNGLTNVFSSLIPKYFDILVMGDFILNMLLVDNVTEGFKSLISEYGLYNIGENPTHFTSNSSSQIDLLMTVNPDKVRLFDQVSFSFYDMIFCSYDILLEGAREELQQFRN